MVVVDAVNLRLQYRFWAHFFRFIKLTLPTPWISESCIKMKINLNFYFHTSSWCLKGLHKTFWGTTKKCENKNLREFFPFVRNFLFFSVIFFFYLGFLSRIFTIHRIAREMEAFSISSLPLPPDSQALKG